MTELTNLAKQRLAAGELAIGVGLRDARTVDIAKAMKTAGYDWLFIDLEHNSMSVETCAQISTAALDVGIAPLVRVPKGQHWLSAKVLDGGALGIVMPHVDTAEEAREVVETVKYPPLGHRSLGGALVHFDFAAGAAAERTQTLNRETLVVVMLESPAAIANAADIAAVEGVDVVMIGTNDLTVEMGIAGDKGDARVVAAYETVIAACAASGKWVGMGGVYDEDLLGRYVGMGVGFVLSGSDTGFLIAAASARAKFVRGLSD